MSETPAWLTEEATTAAKSPAAQKAAVSAASNPAVQAAAVNASKNPVVQQAAWAAATGSSGGDVEDQVERPPPLDIDPAELKEMEKYALALKVFYMCCAIMLAASAWIYILNDGSDITKVFLAGYVFVFSIQICCFELAVQACSRVIASNFGFMYNGIGRGLYLVFVACLALNLGDLGIAAMAFLLLGVVLNIIIVFQFPKYTMWLRRKHYENLHTK
jgi:hypothetical protein